MTNADGRATTVVAGKDMDADEVTLVTVEAAATLAGVSPRTVRRWIQKGFLLSRRDLNGHLVSPADLPAAKLVAGQGRGRGHDKGSHVRGRGYDSPAMSTDSAMADMAAVNAQARTQLEAIRDEWLTPYVEKIERLARENGRLEAEQNRIAAELEQERTLRRQVDELAAAVERRERAHERGAEQLVTALEQERDELRRCVAKLEAERREDAPGAAAGAGASADPFVAGPPAWRRAPSADRPATPRRPWWRRLLGLP